MWAEARVVKRERAVAGNGWGRMVGDLQWDLRCNQLVQCGLLSWDEVGGFFNSR